MLLCDCQSFIDESYLLCLEDVQLQYKWRRSDILELTAAKSSWPTHRWHWLSSLCV